MRRGVGSQAIRRLEEWKEKGEAHPKLVEFYQRLLRIQSRAERRAGIPKPGLSSEAISDRLEHGLPLIVFDELDLDWSLLKDVFIEVASTFARYPKLFGAVPDSLLEAGSGHLPLRAAVKAWFERARLPSTMVTDDVSQYLLEAIIYATLSPFLGSYSKALLGLVNQEHWRRRYCPICGGSPDFAYLDKESGARWLLCSRCGAEWLFQRLECPYCGNKDQTALSYFTDDEALYRLYVCEKCRTYLKAIDLRHTELEVLLPLERTMTLDMDRQAQEQGYKPGRFKVSGMTTPQSEGS